MKIKLDKWQKDFNKNVYAGLAGGLLVYFSQIGIEEAINQNLLPDTFICKTFGALILAILLFIILAINPILKRKLIK